MDATGPRPSVAFFDLATRRVHHIVDLPNRPEPYGDSLAVSPDGRSIPVSQRESVSGDIMLVEGLE